MESESEIEIEVDNIRPRNIYIPSPTFIIIMGIISLFLILIFERLFIYIFLLIIPSYFLLILTWIIVHLFILRYIILTVAFPGKNIFIQFYLRNIQARLRANSLKVFLIDLNDKIDKLLNIPNSENIINEEINTDNSFISINYPLSIYNKVIENYGNLNNEYEVNFYNELTNLKNMINKTSLAYYSKKLGKKNFSINIPKEERNEYLLIKNQITKIINILKELLFENNFEIKKTFKYIHSLIYNNIFRSIYFLRIQSLKKYIYQEIKINSNSYKLDCIIIKCDKYKKENELIKNLIKNIVIICGPNLTPYENLIKSWNIEKLYLKNNTDVLFWNYRGFEFSEGSVNLNNVKEDIENIYDYILNLGIYKKIAVHGLSVGGISACHLAKNRNLDLLIADRTFGSVKGIINSFTLKKYLMYLAQILFIPFIDNSHNFIHTVCNKVLLNDCEDKTIIDKISLKSEISKKCIFKIFNETNIDLNIRKIESYNILDYALEPIDNKNIFECFKYTIDFIKLNKNKKKKKLYEDNLNNNNLEENLNNNDLNMKKIIDIYYKKLKSFYHNFSSCGDSLGEFIEYDNDREHFDNFFNNFFIYGGDEKNTNYSFCNINQCQEILNEFIYNSENEIINNEEIRKYSEYDLYIKFNTFLNCIKNFKIFILGIHLEKIEEDWMKNFKGTLIPLYCGHIAFYDEKEFDTLVYIVKKEMIDNNESFIFYGE